jgi:hypothetical protein
MLQTFFSLFLLSPHGSGSGQPDRKQLVSSGRSQQRQQRLILAGGGQVRRREANSDRVGPIPGGAGPILDESRRRRSGQLWEAREAETGSATRRGRRDGDGDEMGSAMRQGRVGGQDRRRPPDGRTRPTDGITRLGTVDHGQRNDGGCGNPRTRFDTMLRINKLYCRGAKDHNI